MTRAMRAGPDLAAEAVGLRPVPEEFRDQPPLLHRQPTITARGGVGTQGIRATPFCSSEPLADGWLRDAKRLGDGPLRPATALQLSARIRRHSFQSRYAESVVSILHSTARNS